MKHTLIIGIAAVALSACTCTCPDRQYNLQYVPQNYQASTYQMEFLPPSHMMTHYDKNMHSNSFYERNMNLDARYGYDNRMDSNLNMEYRRYTQIKYSQPQEEVQYSYQYQQPQQAEIIYYPVYQSMPAQPKYQDNCGCQQYNPCGC